MIQPVIRLDPVGGIRMAKEQKSHHEESEAALAADAPVKAVPKERAHFRALLIGNPNYFGNLTASPLPPVMPIQTNTTYEEIGCVGFHPQSRRLDAVVFIKQPTGYGGDVCSKGT